MNIQEKKYLASPVDGGLDADSADFAVGTNKVVNAENVRWGSTDTGVTGVVESVGGTRQISEGLPSLTFYTIGNAVDDARNRILFFKYCVSGPWHRITCYDKDADIEYVVLLSSQVTGGLNFSKDRIIHSARVINNLLIWTDEGDTQHKINIDAGIKLNHPSYNTDEAPYVSPISQEAISLIKRDPRVPLEVVKVTQPSLATNFIGNNSFWFSYRYVFRDKETSVVSTHSQLIPYNATGQTYNRVDISVPFLEVIDQDVERVEVGVRVDSDSQFFGIKVWDKGIAADLAAINAHNAGTTQLSFSFYNNKVGVPWGDSYSVKPFESCPVRSKTLEIVRNRVHLANNTAGYTAPLQTSLTVEVDAQTEGGAVTGTWYRFDWNDGFDSGSYYLIYINSIGTNNGYYSLLPYPGITSLPVPTSIDFNDYELAAVTQGTIAGYYGLRPADTVAVVNIGTTATVSNAPTSTDLVDSLAYKTAAQYQFGVVFYDRYDRKCGVVTADGIVAETPDRDYNGTTYASNINFELSNANALVEIPAWAHSYAVVRTKCLRTRFFLQARGRDIVYAAKDATTGVYTFTATTYSGTSAGVAVDISALGSYGLGYLYEEGSNDQIKIYINGASTVYTLRVIDQQGSWVIGSLADLGSLASADCLFEIYRPYISSTSEPFYEVGQKYLVLNPETDNRAYTVLSDSIRGDIYLKERNEGGLDYLTENMSLNDRFYANWYDDSGRPNFIDRLGQVYKPNSDVWSNTYILGSNINGLCEFEALNEKFIPYECGQIQKLQVASKVQNEQGAVMLAICESQTASLYIGEVQLVGATSNAFLAQSPEVIGTINVLKGNFGTTNPESVVEYRGLVFWVDISSGRVIQYSANGLFPISSYKMTRFWKLFSDQYARMTTAQIEALGSRPFLFTAVDPYHGELLITIPKLLSTPPKGYLPDLGEEVLATGSISVTDVGDDGDSIQVLVNDPSLGSVSLGTYVKQQSDTNNIILAASIANAIASNPYGYTATSSSNVVTITARSGLGASINGGMRLSVNIVSPDKLLINGTDFLLINSNSKLLL